MVYKLAKKHFLKLIELNGSPTSIEVIGEASHYPVVRHRIAIIWENTVVVPSEFKTKKIVRIYENHVYTKSYKSKLTLGNYHLSAIERRNALESYKNAASFRDILLTWLKKYSTEITDEIKPKDNNEKSI